MGGVGELGGERAEVGERERKERGDGGAGRRPGEEGKRKKRSAKLPNASYGGSFVLRRGSRSVERSICGSSHK